MSTESFDSDYSGKPMGGKQALDILLKTGQVPESIDQAMDMKNGAMASTAGESQGEPKEKPSPADMLNELGQDEQGAGAEGEDQGQLDQGVDGQDVPEEGEPQSDVEVITADGREIEVDWNDRESIKKTIQKAAAYRSEKKAKDQALSKLQDEIKFHGETRAETERLTGILTKLEQAKEIGPEALIKLVFNRDLSEFQTEWAEREGWSDEQRDSYAKGLEVKKLQAEMAAMKQQAENDRIEASRLKEEAALKSVQNHFEASYRKHSLEGAIGDAEIEDELDDRLFEKVKAKFDSMEIEDIRPADIEEAMKNERARLLRIYLQGAEKRTSANIADKKKAAVVAAQAKSSGGEPRKSVANKIREATTKPGGWRSILGDPEMLSALSRK